ncbi:MAG: NAD+ synthase [Planctomycetes bacterium]|nr:NAD+ synthase [Planctomycetota bacterium]
MKLGLLQLNPTVADFDGNLAAIERAARDCVSRGAELCIAPELAVSGYPPHDLMLYPDFLAANEAAKQRLLKLSAELHCGLLFGLVTANPNDWGKPLHNSAVLCDKGVEIAVKHKALLPTYDVFDERRYFEPELSPCVATFRGRRIGLLICEDIWTDSGLLGRIPYEADPALACMRGQAELLINISASPWGTGKHRLREELVKSVCKRTGLTTVLVNQVGANDDLVFDGASVAVSGGGAVLARLPLFEEHAAVLDLTQPPRPQDWREDDAADEIDALTLGIRDYYRKTGFKKALIGLSGGIDSAVVTCLAAQALGPENVHAISMPTRFSSRGSVEDSRQLAEKLGCGFEVIDIDEAFELQRKLAGFPGGLPEENAQARLRGLVLMTRSNAEGSLVLATGNRSELAVGYSTLYGDMCGALEVIGDVAKTRVYQIARHFPEIPEAIHTKAPSAELRPNQTDQDSLPPYEVLDAILEAYLDDHADLAEMQRRGLDPAICRKIVRMVEIAEFKRRQAPIVLRISKRAFGAGRRVPVAKRL